MSIFRSRRSQIEGLNRGKTLRWVKRAILCCVFVAFIFSIYFYFQQPLTYLNGQKALENNDYIKAFSLLMKIPRYKDSMIKIQAINRAFQVISDSEYNIVGIRADGSVSVVGRNDNGQCEVRDWKDIIAISAGTGYTVGLKVNRTVVATKFIPSDELKYYGQCEVSNWKDIIEISTGIQHTVGLKSDGTVVAVGSNEFGQCDVSAWKDIVAVSAGAFHTVGLKSNGTVVATGKNEDAQCDVSSWKHIVKISAGWVHTVGLMSDGSVVAVGNNVRNQCDVKKMEKYCINHFWRWSNCRIKKRW